MKRLDCVIASLPFIEYYLPPAAPAVLKGHLESKGFTVKTFDLNITVKEYFEKKDLVTASAFFHNNSGEINFQKELLDEINKLVDIWVDKLLEHNPRFIGLSVFSIDSRKACEILTARLKNKKHDSKIFIGGMGVEEEWLESITNNIDYYIMGEGELACENLLKGNLDFEGINGKVTQIKNLNQLGVPDYQDYDLSLYDKFYDGKKVVQITGSRGCVRNCSFCNVNAHWPSFTWRSSESIIEEITAIYNTHGITDFFFTDSLINGNIKVYMQMVESLANFNQKTNAKITWGGQYIVRKSKNLSKEYFALTRDSGAYNLALGVESGSNDVLLHMRKGVTREDTDEFIENFDKHDITCSYQMLIGYPTETDKNFEETLDLFYDHQKYVASGTIHGTSLNTTMSIYKGIPLEKFPEKVFVRDKSEDGYWGWTSTVVPGLDWEKRLRRRLIAQEVCDLLNWPTISADRELGTLLKKHESYLAWKKGITLTNIQTQPEQSHLS
jgi:hypothetical protein|tara:strand:- start:760 stop:2253 length:1494 start_codon:yes stop_codon:yes gene_type:complete